MRRRAIAIVALMALVLGAVVPAGAVAKSSVARFPRLNVSRVDPQLLPALVDPSRTVDVIVQMTDQPVAGVVGDAKDNGTSVTKSQRDSWRSQVQAKQKPVVDAVRKAGGVVVSQMQDAYNGIHVHVKAAQVTTLAAMAGRGWDPPRSRVQAGPDRERALRRRAAGLDDDRLHRRRGQDRGHRHRRRLLPRRLRRVRQHCRLRLRPGPRHDRAGVQRQRHDGRLPERQGAGWLRLRRRRLRRQRAGRGSAHHPASRRATRSTATATAPTPPAPRRARASCPTAPHMPGRTTRRSTAPTDFRIGPGVAPQATPLHLSRLRLRRFHRRRHRGHQPGRPGRRGRDQHVPRLRLRHFRHSRCRRLGQRRPAPASWSWLRPATKARAPT